MNKICVLGVLPLLTHYAIVLFDTGASHSFISVQFAKDHSLATNYVKEEWQIKLPSRGTMLLAKYADIAK